MSTISANVLVRNEKNQVDGFVKNMIEVGIDEIIFLDGGSTDGTYERLLYWKNKYPFIHVLLWEQPQGSSYKKGFNEVARRNLMIEASSMDWCLYIDIDERIPFNFKKNILQIKRGKIIAFPFCHYWSEHIRVNLNDDRVWYPNMHFRLFRRCDQIRFGSKDKNGLHNFISYRGKRVVDGSGKKGLMALLVKGYKLYLRYFYGIQVYTVNSIHIFHFHYFDLSTPKENDLRRKEFDYRIELVSSIEGGMQYKLSDGIVPCVETSQIDLAEEVKQKYIHDLGLHSNS